MAMTINLFMTIPFFLFSIFLNLFHFLHNQWVIGGLEIDGFKVLLQRLEDDEEGGDDEEKAESAEEHAADSAYADGKKYVYLSP